MARPIIVGLDSGTTAAVAVLDLEGKLINVSSRKNIQAHQIKGQILQYGNPVIIATDKSKVPGAVSKLAASFGCKVYSPNEDLKVSDKKSITDSFTTSNIHEMDALSSALFAFKSFSRQFDAIERVATGKEAERVKEMIILNKAKNISEAVNKLKPVEEKIEDRKGVEWKVVADQYRKQLSSIRKRYEVLEIYTKKIEQNLKDLAKQKKRFIDEQMKKNNKIRKEIMKEKEIRVRDILIKQMQLELKKQRDLAKIYDSQIKKEQEFKAIRTSNKIPVIIIDEFSKEKIMDAHRESGLKDQVIRFKSVKDSNKAAKTLVGFSPKVILNKLDGSVAEELKREGIIVVDIEPDTHEFYGSVSSDRLKDAIKERERRDFMEWLEKYRKRESFF